MWFVLFFVIKRPGAVVHNLVMVARNKHMEIITRVQFARGLFDGTLVYDRE